MHLNRQQLAESFGVSEEVVEEWLRYENLPHTIDRDRPVFRRDKVAGWAKARGLTAVSGFLAKAEPALNDGSSLGALLRAGGIWRDIPAADVRAALVRVVAEVPGVSAPIRGLLSQRIQSTGGMVWAPVGHGFALPHLSARVALGRDAGVVALVLLREPLIMEDPVPDSEPVKSLFFFIAPTPRGHLDLLAKLARLIHYDRFIATLKRDANDEAIFSVIEECVGNPAKSIDAAAAIDPSAAT